MRAKLDNSMMYRLVVAICAVTVFICIATIIGVAR